MTTQKQLAISKLHSKHTGVNWKISSSTSPNFTYQSSPESKYLHQHNKYMEIARRDFSNQPHQFWREEGCPYQMFPRVSVLELTQLCGVAKVTVKSWVLDCSLHYQLRFGPVFWTEAVHRNAKCTWQQTAVKTFYTMSQNHDNRDGKKQPQYREHVIIHYQ